MFQKQTNRSSVGKYFFTSLLTSLLVGILLLFLYGKYGPTPQIQNQTKNSGKVTENQQIPAPQQLSTTVTDNTATISERVADTATPGVVGISVLKVDGGSIFDKNLQEQWGVGSGVIVRSNGYILTNYHIAGGKNKQMIVNLADGRNFDGITVWSEPILDLAIIKIEAEGLTTIPLGNANALKVGEPAIAIGNPLGLQFQRTVTSGIVSALNRTIKISTDDGTNFMEDLIQTDASINPGNSGGPLLNSKGEVVGINTIKVASAEAIGFAVPVNVAVPVIEKLSTYGKFDEPYIGVFAYDKEVIPYINNVKLEKGIYVSNIDEAGPAYNSGVRVSSVITQIDGKDVNTMLQLRTHIYSKNPGDTVIITCLDNQVPKTMEVKLTKKTKDGLLTR